MEFLEMLSEVENAFRQANLQERDFSDKERKQAAVGLFASYETLDESAFSPSTGNLTLTVIRPGWSKNNRYYPPDVLRNSANIFESAKMFVDHQTQKDEQARPEGSIKDWVATITGVHAESDGVVRASANVHNEAFKNELNNLKRAGNLNQMGVSIRAFGTVQQGEAEGRKGTIIESLQGCKSVDFVTFAAAGGRVESMSESFDPNDLDYLTISEPTKTALMRDLMESCKLSELEARAIVGLPLNVKHLTSLQRKNYDALRAIGLNESEALQITNL